MSKAFILFTAWLWFSIGIAQESLDYAERVESYSSSSGRIEVIHRDAIVSDNNPSGLRKISDVIVTQNGKPMVLVGAAEGLVSEDGVRVHFNLDLVGKDFSWVHSVLNHHTISTFAGKDPYSFGTSISFTFPSGYEVPLPSPELYGQALHGMGLMYEYSAAQARAWAQYNERQREAQKRLTETADDRLVKFREQSERHSALSFSRAVQMNTVQESLGRALGNLRLARSVLSGEGNLESIRFSEARKDRMLDSLDEDIHLDPQSAGRVVADLFSPLSQKPSPKIRKELVKRGLRDGILPGSLLGSKSIRFKNPQMEDQRLRLHNQLQAMEHEAPLFFEDRGKDGVRNIQTRLQHAQQMEAAGQIGLAQEKLNQAKEVLQEGLNHEGWSRENYVEALHDLYGQPSHSQKFESTDEEFTKIAGPLAGVFEKEIAKQQSVAGPLSAQKLRAAKHGLEFIKRADQASSRGDRESTEFYSELAIGCMDIVTAFIPPASIVKDGFEAVTGKHWITGRSLTSLERSIAVGGVLTLGVGSGVAKALHKALFVAERAMAAQLLRQGQRISDAFLEASIRSHGAVESLIRQLRTKKPAIRNFEEAENVILNTRRSIQSRVQKLGFTTRTLELIPTNELNRKVLKKKGGIAYARSDRWAMRVEAIKHPEKLVRAHTEGRQVSKWFFHNDLMDNLARKAHNYEDFASQLKNQLNVPKVPTHFSQLKPSRDAYRMTISEIKQVDKWGEAEGQLQFFIENSLSKENFSAPQSLKEYFESIRRR